MIGLLLVLPVLAAAGPIGEEPPAAIAPEDYLVIPLHVHVLRSATLEEVDCRLTDEDIARVIGKVNRVWSQAGVHFGVATLRREPAANEERYRTLRDLVDGEAPPHRIFGVLRPEATRDDIGLHVYFVHEFDVNGVYMGRGFAFVKETARLREVEGGIDEPLPRVTAHELGHALGLEHRQARTNLLASGTTGTSLNADEVAQAREQARSRPDARSVAELTAEAAEAQRDGDTAHARRLLGWLAELPGEAAERAREQLDSLPD